MTKPQVDKYRRAHMIRLSGPNLVVAKVISLIAKTMEMGGNFFFLCNGSMMASE